MIRMTEINQYNEIKGISLFYYVVLLPWVSLRQNVLQKRHSSLRKHYFIILTNVIDARPEEKLHFKIGNIVLRRKIRMFL